MRQRINAWLQTSFVYRALSKCGVLIGDFLGSSLIFTWFGNEEPSDGNSRSDRLVEKFLASKFCDFLRSGVLLRALASLTVLPWLFLMLTLLGAMVLPTLAVMLLSLATLCFTVLALIFRKLSMPAVTGGIRVWFLFVLITFIYTFVNYGGLKGVLAGGIRCAMLPLLPCAWIILGQGRQLWKTLYTFALACLGVGLYGMYQYLSGTLSTRWTDVGLFSEDFGRLVSTFENPNVYGTFLLIAIPVLAVATFFAKGWRGKAFFGFTTVLLTVNMFLTYSRGCYVSLLLAVLVLLICRGRGWLWGGIGVLVLSPLYLPQDVLARISSIGNLGDTSVAYRIHIWMGSLDMLKQYWWMGVGIGDTAFRKLYEQHALTAVEDAPHAHNLFLQTVAESGILGLLILILLFAFLFRTAVSALRRSEGAAKWLRLGLIAAWSGLLLQGMTDYIFYNNNLFAIMMISLGCMVACVQRKEEKNEG